MRLASVAVIVVTALAVSCAPVTKSAAGIVVSVDQASLTDIRTFTLRTQAGDTLIFRVGALDLSSGGFPANHLREHLATSIPVEVAYTEANGERVAVRLVDAPSDPRGSSPTVTATPVILDPPPPTTDSPKPGSAFTSTRYGYTFATPEGWTVTETPGMGGVHPGEPGVDTFNDLLGHTLSVVREPAVPALEAWTCAICRHLQGEHALVAEQVVDLTVAGMPARLSAYHLIISPYVIHYLTVEIVRGGQGFTLSLESTTGNDDDDRAILDSILRSLSFTE